MRDREKYNGEKYKWFCNECGNTWFSNTGFEDLCANTLCESEHIFEVEIKPKDIKKLQHINKKIKQKKRELAELKAKKTGLSWIK